MSLTEKQKVGRLGEDVAVKYFEKQGFEIVERNYLKKWGELDIVARSRDKLHFIEVKTVTYRAPEFRNSDDSDDHEPEENVHSWKRKRLSRAIQTYLLERRVPDETEFQVDIISVYLNLKDKKAQVRYLPDIAL